MDIWSWVYDKQYELEENGNQRLAEIIMEISSFTVNGEHNKVDSVVPEGLALARSLKEKWIEVFLRHWHLQSLILHRYEVGKALPEAIKLLDFESAVNVTLGLPMVRTSVDHGTAFDIAYKGIASTSSFCNAFELAKKLI